MIPNIEPQQLVDYIGHTNALIEKSAGAVTELATVKAEREKVAKMVPETVEILLANNRIRPDQKEAATQALLDPARTLLLMQKLATHRNDKELAAIGTAVSEDFGKLAGAHPIGATSADETPESSRRLFAAMGITLAN